MSTQKPYALKPQNVQMMAGRLAESKAARPGGRKADLDKLAKADIEQEIVQAESPTDAPVEVAMAEGMDSPQASGIGAMTGASAADGAAAVNPLAVGAAAVLGVAAIAAMSGGGGSSGSSNDDAIQQKPSTDDPSRHVQPGNDDPSKNPSADVDHTKPTLPSGGGVTPDNQTPPAGEKKYGLADAQGEAAAPKVSPDGETRLTVSKAAFIAKLRDAGVDVNDASKQFIRIDRIEASEMGGDHGSRLVRYPEQSDQQGIQLKAPADPAKPTAYEVIRVEAGITLADARAAAEKVGGKLLVVDDAAEAQWLKGAFKNLLGADKVGAGAWIGGSKLQGAAEADAAVRTEDATDISYSKAAGEKLTAYVVEFENYQHPLTLDGEPVAEGQVINAADFDKLVWRGDGNKGGRIQFSVVENDAATAPGAITGTLTITESVDVVRPEIPNDAGPDKSDHTGSSNTGAAGTNPAVPVEKPLPTYPAGNTQTAEVKQDQADATLSKTLFIGSADTHPDFIKILEVKLPGVAQDNDTKALVFETAEGVKNEVVNGVSETVVNSAFFHKISWNAALANGGEIRFVPVADQHGTPIKNAMAQIVTINEAAAPAPADTKPTDLGADAAKVPTYGTEPLESAVASNNKPDHNFSSMKAAFEGTGETKATHIRITEIMNGSAGTSDVAEGTLKYENQNVMTGDDGTLIDLSKLDQLVWDASKAVGGSFKFTAVQASGEAFANPPATQSVTINEPPRVPGTKEHQSNKNNDTSLGSDLFEFGDEGKAQPGFVKITSIFSHPDELADKRVVNTDTDTAYQVVKVGGDGISKEDAMVAAEKMGGKLLEITDKAELDWIKGNETLMGKLNFEASGSAGKGVWFVNPESGAAEGVNSNAQGISSSGTKPENFNFVVDGTPDDSDPGKLSGYVVEINAFSTAKGVGLRLEGETGKEAVRVGDVIDFNDIVGNKLSWNSVFNSGVDLTFVEVSSKEDPSPVAGAPEKTISSIEGTTGLDRLLENHEIL